MVDIVVLDWLLFVSIILLLPLELLFLFVIISYLSIPTNYLLFLQLLLPILILIPNIANNNINFPNINIPNIPSTTTLTIITININTMITRLIIVCWFNIKIF